MGQDLRTNAELVARTTRRCLVVADELGAQSIALPGIRAGVGGFPLDECARLLVAEARRFGGRSPRRVVVAGFGADAAATLGRRSRNRSATRAYNPADEGRRPRGGHGHPPAPPDAHHE